MDNTGIEVPSEMDTGQDNVEQAQPMLRQDFTPPRARPRVKHGW